MENIGKTTKIKLEDLNLSYSMTDKEGYHIDVKINNLKYLGNGKYEFNIKNLGRSDKTLKV